MPSYMTTPLFSIQEAVNSASSLPHIKESRNPISVYSDRQYPKQKPTDDYKQDKLVFLIENYKKSENEYSTELRVLESIVKSFDPVYNNYFDSSLDDITDEMVKFRKDKNAKLYTVIQHLILKHNELYQLLHFTDLDTMLVNLSEWGVNINQLYKEYNGYYKLDIHQAKSEVQIRRRPLIRIRYLNNFFKSLKNIVIQMDERPYSAELLSNLEVIIFKLSKSLEDARLLDESERQRWDNFIFSTNCKDIVQLKSICVDLKPHDFDSESYNCNLHYINKLQKTTLNFFKCDVIFLKNRTFDQIAIVQKDTFGKNLVFSPLRMGEFKLDRTVNDSNGKSILFNHSIIGTDIQICFTMTENTDPQLSEKLLDLFPQVNDETTYEKPCFGLRIQNVQTTNYISKEIQDSKLISTTIPIEKSISIASNFEAESEQHVFRKETTNKPSTVIPKMNSNNTSSNDLLHKQDPDSKTSLYDPSNVPLYKLKFANSSTDIASGYLNKSTSIYHTNEQLETRIDVSSSKILSQKIIQQVINDDTSDEESIVSATEELQFVPISKLPTPVKLANPTSAINSDHTEISKEKSDDHSISQKIQEIHISEVKPKSLMNFDKYKNSLLINDDGLQQPNISHKKKKRQSIFNSLANIISKKNSKISTITAQKVTNKLSVPKEVSPTKSLHSISSIANDKVKDEKSMNIVSDSNCISTQLPNAKISLWTMMKWTKSKEVQLFLHKLSDNEIYLGMYHMIEKSISNNSISSSTSNENKTPLLLLKLDKNMDCMVNTIDIHLKTFNCHNELLTVLIRPLDHNAMKIISNALICPEAVDILVNSSSCDSDLSKQSVETQETSTTSIESEELVDNIDEEIDHIISYGLEKVTKTWTGVGSINLLQSDGKLKDLNRCVFSVVNKNDKNINFDLTGFDFGNIELNVGKDQIRELEELQVVVKGRENYILVFDSLEDINLFYECIR